MALLKVECDSSDSLAAKPGMVFIDRAGTLRMFFTFKILFLSTAMKVRHM